MPSKRGGGIARTPPPLPELGSRATSVRDRSGIFDVTAHRQLHGWGDVGRYIAQAH